VAENLFGRKLFGRNGANSPEVLEGAVGEPREVVALLVAIAMPLALVNRFHLKKSHTCQFMVILGSI
jgi:hypothetical protein